MPTARQGLALTAAANGKLYAVGGRDNTFSVRITRRHYRAC
jgi:hypothetical protein